MKGYLLRLTAGALLAALIRRIAPGGGPGRAAKLGAGLLVLIVALGPILLADPLAAAENLVRRDFGEPLTTQTLEMANQRLLSALISDEARAYILDKAGELGLEADAQVEVQPAEGYPVPWAVTLTGEASPDKRLALQEAIARDLGVPEDRQEWLDMG